MIVFVLGHLNWILICIKLIRSNTVASINEHFIILFI